MRAPSARAPGGCCALKGWRGGRGECRKGRPSGGLLDAEAQGQQQEDAWAKARGPWRGELPVLIVRSPSGSEGPALVAGPRLVTLGRRAQQNAKKAAAC